MKEGIDNIPDKEKEIETLEVVQLENITMIDAEIDILEMVQIEIVKDHSLLLQVFRVVVQAQEVVALALLLNDAKLFN